MTEIIYLGIGIVGLLVLNMGYLGWRGSQSRKAEAARNNPYAHR